MARTVKPAHYRGTYHVAARRCRQAAYADPDYLCPLCGLTLEQGVRRWGYSRARWSADHTRAGDPTSPLRATHLRCNSSRGQGAHTVDW